MNFTSSKSIVVIVTSLVLGFSVGRLSKKSVADNAEQSASPAVGSSHKNSVANRPHKTSPLLGHLTTSEIKHYVTSENLKQQVDQNPAKMNFLMLEWVQQAPQEALAFAKENQQEQWMYESLKVLGKKNPDQALEWITVNTTDLGLQAYLKGAVYRGLAQQDPELAMSRIYEENSGAQRNQFLSLAIDEWSKQDIRSVFDWIETQEASPFLAATYGQVMGQYIEQSPRDARVIIDHMSEGPDKANFSNRLAFQLAKLDPQEAVNWAGHLEGEAKHLAFMGLLESWGGSDDSEAALAFAKQLPKSEQSYELFSMLSMRMSQANPRKLEAELPNLEGRQKVIATTQLAQVYSANNPGETVEWLDSLGEGIARDQAIDISLQALRQSDISKAFEISQSITDEPTRQAAIQQTLIEWMPVDPEAAYSALENTNALSESRKQVVMRYLERESNAAQDIILPAN